MPFLNRSFLFFLCVVSMTPSGRAVDRCESLLSHEDREAQTSFINRNPTDAVSIGFGQYNPESVPQYVTIELHRELPLSIKQWKLSDDSSERKFKMINIRKVDSYNMLATIGIAEALRKTRLAFGIPDLKINIVRDVLLHDFNSANLIQTHVFYLSFESKKFALGSDDSLRAQILLSFQTNLELETNRYFQNLRAVESEPKLLKKYWMRVSQFYKSSLHSLELLPDTLTQHSYLNYMKLKDQSPRQDIIGGKIEHTFNVQTELGELKLYLVKIQ